MIYFKVKRDSELYNKLIELDIMEEKWWANREKLYNTIGLPITEKLVMSPYVLYYSEIPPMELRNQFKKYRDTNLNCYVAKVNSFINKQWCKLCTEYELSFVSSLATIVQKELFKTPYIIGSELKLIVKIDRDFYLEGEKELPEVDFLEQISEIEYLEVRLKKAKEEENESN